MVVQLNKTHHWKTAGKQGGVNTAKKYGHLHLKEEGKKGFDQLVKKLEGHLNTPNFDSKRSGELAGRLNTKIQQFEKLCHTLYDESYGKILGKRGEPRDDNEKNEFRNVCVGIVTAYLIRYNLPTLEEVSYAKNLVKQAFSYSGEVITNQMLNNLDISLLLLGLNEQLFILKNTHIIAEYKDNDGEYVLEFEYADLDRDRFYTIRLNDHSLYIGKDFSDALNVYYNTISNHLSDKSKNFDPQLGILRDILINQNKYAMQMLSQLGKSELKIEMERWFTNYMVKHGIPYGIDAIDIIHAANYRPAEKENEECHLCDGYSDGNKAFCTRLRLPVKPEYVCSFFNPIPDAPLAEAYAESIEQPYEQEEKHDDTNDELMRVGRFLQYLLQEKYLNNKILSKLFNKTIEKYWSILKDDSHYINFTFLCDKIKEIINSNKLDETEVSKLKSTLNKLLPLIKHGEVDTGNSLLFIQNQEKEKNIAVSTKAFIKNSESKILILFDPSVSLWDLPGGHVQENETTDEAIRREVKEETSLVIETAKELFVKDIKLGKPLIDHTAIFFDVVVTEKSIVLSSEHTDYKWVDSSDYQKYELGIYKEILEEYLLSNITKHHDFNIDQAGLPDENSENKYPKPVGKIDVSGSLHSPGEIHAYKMPMRREQGLIGTRDAILSSIENKYHESLPKPIVGVTPQTQTFEEERKKQGKISSHKAPQSKEQKPIIASGGNRFSRTEPMQQGPVVGAGVRPGTAAQVSQVVVRSNNILTCILKQVESLDYIINNVNHFNATKGILCFENDNGTYHVKFNDNHNLEGVYKLIKQESGNGSSGETGAVLTTATAFTPTYGGDKNKKKLDKSDMPAIMSGKETPPVEGHRNSEKIADISLPKSKKSTPLKCQQVIQEHKGDYKSIVASVEKHKIIPEEEFRQGKKANDTTRDYINLDVKKSLDTLEKLHLPISLLTKDNYNRLQSGKPMIIAGWASLEIKDKEGHIITTDALEEASEKFMRNPNFSNVMLFHSNIQVGRVISSFVAEDGKIFKTHIDRKNKGWYVVVELRTDIGVMPKLLEEIAKGNIRSFSISGNAISKTPQSNATGVAWVIDKIELFEITLCSDPVNPGAYFDVIQAPSIDVCPACETHKDTMFKPIGRI